MPNHCYKQNILLFTIFGIISLSLCLCGCGSLSLPVSSVSLCISVCLSLYLCLSLSVSLYVSLYLCLSLSLCLFVSLYVPFYIYLLRDDFSYYFTCFLRQSSHFSTTDSIKNKLIHYYQDCCFICKPIIPEKRQQWPFLLFIQTIIPDTTLFHTKHHSW